MFHIGSFCKRWIMISQGHFFFKSHTPLYILIVYSIMNKKLELKKNIIIKKK